MLCYVAWGDRDVSSGKMPIAVPKGVDVGQRWSRSASGLAKGTLVRPVNELVTVKNEGGTLKFAPANDSAEADAMSGTMRALVANMVDGVSKGFEKKLTLVGVGFLRRRAGRQVEPVLDRFLAPVVRTCRAGITVTRPTQTEILITLGAGPPGGGPDRRRSARDPSARALQGQGIRYADEKVSPGTKKAERLP